MPDASPPRTAALPWLAEFVGDAPDVLVRGFGRTPALGLALASRRLGARVGLAREYGVGEAVGIDLVHGAINALLARGALPQAAVLDIVAPRESDFAVALAAGVARACRSHELPLAPGLVAASDGPESLSLTLAGAVLATPVVAREAGDVVLALRGNGPCDLDLPLLLGRARQLGLGLGDRLPAGDLVGPSLLAAQRSQLSLLQQPLRERWPAWLLDVQERALVPTLQTVLPPGLGVEWTFDDWRPPAPFGDWFVGPTALRRAAEASSCGCGMLVVVAAVGASRWLELCAAWNEPATLVGRLVAAGAGS